VRTIYKRGAPRLLDLTIITYWECFVTCFFFHFYHSHLATVNLEKWREQQMDSKCRELKKQKPKQHQQWSQMFVNNRRRSIFCAVPKSGSTTWRYILLKLAVKHVPKVAPNNKNKMQLHALLTPRNLNKIVRQGHHYNSTQRRALMRTYYKFMFVREPLERLISAYRYSILHGRGPGMSKIIRTIKRRRHSLNNVSQGKNAQHVICLWNIYLSHCYSSLTARNRL